MNENERRFREAATIRAARTFAEGRFEEVRLLGKGGMGRVYLARDLQLNGIEVALKVLDGMVGDAEVARLATDEMMVGRKLVHPNIVQLRDFVRDGCGGSFLLTMDYVPGESLAQRLERQGPLTEEETLEILKPIAAALDYAHQRNILHRDVKPSNIMIQEDGTPMLLDFGISRRLGDLRNRVTGRYAEGTQRYLPPEAFRLQPVEATQEMLIAQDVYSLAVTAYECLCGKSPFADGDIASILNLPPPDLPSGIALTQKILAGLSKDWHARPTSCSALFELPPAANISASGATGLVEMGAYGDTAVSVAQDGKTAAIFEDCTTMVDSEASRERVIVPTPTETKDCTSSMIGVAMDIGGTRHVVAVTSQPKIVAPAEEALPSWLVPHMTATAVPPHKTVAVPPAPTAPVRLPMGESELRQAVTRYRVMLAESASMHATRGNVEIAEMCRQAQAHLRDLLATVPLDEANLTEAFGHLLQVGRNFQAKHPGEAFYLENRRLELALFLRRFVESPVQQAIYHSINIGKGINNAY